MAYSTKQQQALLHCLEQRSEEPLTAAAVSGTTGTQHTDANEYTPSFACVSPELPLTVDARAVEVFLGGSAW